MAPTTAPVDMREAPRRGSAGPVFPFAGRPAGSALCDQEQPLVVPQEPQTKHEPAGCMVTPQV